MTATCVPAGDSLTVLVVFSADSAVSFSDAQARDVACSLDIDTAHSTRHGFESGDTSSWSTSVGDS